MMSSSWNRSGSTGGACLGPLTGLPGPGAATPAACPSSCCSATGAAAEPGGCAAPASCTPSEWAGASSLGNAPASCILSAWAEATAVRWSCEVARGCAAVGSACRAPAAGSGWPCRPTAAAGPGPPSPDAGGCQGRPPGCGAWREGSGPGEGVPDSSRSGIVWTGTQASRPSPPLPSCAAPRPALKLGPRSVASGGDWGVGSSASPALGLGSTKLGVQAPPSSCASVEARQPLLWGRPCSTEAGDCARCPALDRRRLLLLLLLLAPVRGGSSPEPLRLTMLCGWGEDLACLVWLAARTAASAPSTASRE